jgi:hypothetical protein
MTPSVPEEFTGSKSELPAALETASRRSGIEFSIDEFYEGSDHGYPTYYVEASIQYRAMFDLQKYDRIQYHVRRGRRRNARRAHPRSSGHQSILAAGVLHGRNLRRDIPDDAGNFSSGKFQWFP